MPTLILLSVNFMVRSNFEFFILFFFLCFVLIKMSFRYHPEKFSNPIGSDSEKGAGIFVTTVVVGSIMLTREFEIMKRPLMRDIIFYLITTTLVWTTFLERKILIYHSILFIIIYIVYVFVVIVSGYIYKRNLQNQSSMISVNRMMPRENLNLQKKYKINGPQNSNASLKSLSFVKKFDCDEGVVLTSRNFKIYHISQLISIHNWNH